MWILLFGTLLVQEHPDFESLFLSPDQYVLVPAGTFDMGSAGVPDEQPVRRVTVSRSFYLGKYEVTQAQWRAVMGKNPSHFKSGKRPVEMVTFDAAVGFIQTLNRKLGGTFFRLPTEAEWEYACRAGVRDTKPPSTVAWYSENAGGQTHPVGSREPNPWGLYDMRGNVWEWVSDWYQADYANLATIDPRGPARGEHRTMRGGDWDGSADQCGCTFRGNDQHGGKQARNVYGFRLVWLRSDRSD